MWIYISCWSIPALKKHTASFDIDHGIPSPSSMWCIFRPFVHYNVCKSKKPSMRLSCWEATFDHREYHYTWVVLQVLSTLTTIYICPAGVFQPLLARSQTMSLKWLRITKIIVCLWILALAIKNRYKLDTLPSIMTTTTTQRIYRSDFSKQNFKVARGNLCESSLLNQTN